MTTGLSSPRAGCIRPGAGHPREAVAPHGREIAKTTLFGNRSTSVVLVLRRARHPLAEIDYMQVFEDHKNDLRR